MDIRLTILNGIPYVSSYTLANWYSIDHNDLIKCLQKYPGILNETRRLGADGYLFSEQQMHVISLLAKNNQQVLRKKINEAFHSYWVNSLARQMPTKQLFRREYKNHDICFSIENNRIMANALQICQALNVNIFDYLTTTEASQALSDCFTKMSKFVDQIFVYHSGPSNAGGGIWIVEELIEELALWLSDDSLEFVEWCEKRIEELKYENLIIQQSRAYSLSFSDSLEAQKLVDRAIVTPIDHVIANGVPYMVFYN
ncbi:hypothetical protein [Spirosoma litoris]